MVLKAVACLARLVFESVCVCGGVGGHSEPALILPFLLWGDLVKHTTTKLV